MIKLLSFLIIIFYVQYCSYVSQNQKISSHSEQDMICSVSFHEKEIWFCLISQNKNSVLSHLMKNESDSVSFHWKKIWFCLISSKKNLILSYFIEKNSCLILILIQDRIRSGWEILILVISLCWYSCFEDKNLSILSAKLCIW